MLGGGAGREEDEGQKGILLALKVAVNNFILSLTPSNAMFMRLERQ